MLELSFEERPMRNEHSFIYGFLLLLFFHFPLTQKGRREEPISQRWYSVFMQRIVKIIIFTIYQLELLQIDSSNEVDIELATFRILKIQIIQDVHDWVKEPMRKFNENDCEEEEEENSWEKIAFNVKKSSKCENVKFIIDLEYCST